jgi:hypothetical protein
MVGTLTSRKINKKMKLLALQPTNRDLQNNGGL